MTLGTQWSWKPNDQLKTSAQVLKILAQCAGGDGNLLLDVGPMPDGRIEARQVEILKQVGDWLARNGESIYGTRGNIIVPQQWGVVTYKNKTLYAHVLNMPQQPYIFLPLVKGKVTKVTLMSDGTGIKYKQQPEGLFVYADNIKPDDIDTIIEITTN